jgi:hypothetical protein
MPDTKLAGTVTTTPSAPRTIASVKPLHIALSENWSEDQHQERLFQWATVQCSQYPELRLLHSIPNGAYMHISTAARMNRTGRRKGVPDVMLPVARRGYAGLYIEMKKVKGGRVDPEQKQWHTWLREQGYRVEVCRGFPEAVDVITHYLNGWNTPGLLRSIVDQSNVVELSNAGGDN